MVHSHQKLHWIWKQPAVCFCISDKCQPFCWQKGPSGVQWKIIHMTVVYSCQDMEYVTRSLPGHRKGVTKSSDEEISFTEHLPCSHECIICCTHQTFYPSPFLYLWAHLMQTHSWWVPYVWMDKCYEISFCRSATIFGTAFNRVLMKHLGRVCHNNCYFFFLRCEISFIYYSPRVSAWTNSAFAAKCSDAVLSCYTT